MKPVGRLILTLILAIVIVLVAIFAVENRAPVAVDFWPLPWTARLPLYLAVLGAAAVGLIVGAILCTAARWRLWLRMRASERRADRLARAAARPPATPPSPSPTAAPPSRALAPRGRGAGDDD